MSALRRHLFAVTWAILSVQALGAALGVAPVCRDQAHTHGGVTMPDCPMHHQHEPAAQPGADHSHHSVPPRSEDPDAGGARMSCRCAGEITPLYAGQIAILEPALSHSPFVRTALLDVVTDRVTDRGFSPPSPPPR